MRRPRALPLALLALLAGCGADSGGPAAPDRVDQAGAGGAGPITRLAGYLLVHQFFIGAHASFLDTVTPLPLAGLDGREPFSLPYAAVLREGPCLLYLQPHCTPDCPGENFCSADGVCTPLSPVSVFDIGSYQVTGGRVTPLIRLFYVPHDGYESDPASGATADFFAGGEMLTASGGEGPYALQVTWTAPQPVQVLEPPVDSPLQLPLDGPFALRWTPAGAEQMVLDIAVGSTQDASWGTVHCLLPDDGSFEVPAKIISALPRPPRTTRYELERDNEVLVPLGLGPGVGMLVHASFSAWQAGEDPPQ